MAIDYFGFAYAATVAGGGIFGYIKAQSVPSLAAGLIFGGLLGYGAVQLSNNANNWTLSMGTSTFLTGLMGYRFLNSGKLMPAGLVAGISLAPFSSRISGFTDSELFIQPAGNHSRRKPRSPQSKDMEHSTTVAQIHKSPPARVHGHTRRNRSQSRHEKHKCHKHRLKQDDGNLQAQVIQLKNENYILTRRLNASISSLDSGLPTTENLPPIDIDLKNAYHHVKNENNQLIEEIRILRSECEKLKISSNNAIKENSTLHEDISMLKNLVYRLNVELEKLQDIKEQSKSGEGTTTKKTNFELPKYYNKNFLRPIYPLLKAYSEVIEEKNEMIERLESNFEKFSVNFNELFRENEMLYKDLELKMSKGDATVFDDVKALRREIDILKDEKDLFCNQARLEAEKVKELHAVYKSKVTQLEKEKELLAANFQDVKGELCNLKGRQSVLTQELQRMRIEDESKVPLTVHSASIGECKRLFQDLKNEHESERQMLEFKLKELDNKLRAADANLKKVEEERLNLEHGNFDLAFENEALKKKLNESEHRAQPPADQNQGKNEYHEIKTQLKEAKKRNFELDGKLQKTKKQLQQSMAFAEDIVREQESLLAQLHEKQRENSLMVSQFGSLRNQLKTVEKGAQEGLNCVESKIKAQEEENVHLTAEVERLTELLKVKTFLEPSTDDLTS